MAAVYKSRRVLLVTNDLGPRAGGIESFILGLLEQLDGSEIVIFTSSAPDSQGFDLELKNRLGVEIIRDRAKILLPTPRVNRAASKIISDYQSEIIWYGAMAPLAWMSGHLKRNGAKRQITLTHGHEVWWSKVWPFTQIMRAIARNLDLVGYLGDYTHHAMLPILGATQAKRIAPGIAIDHFTPGPKSQSLLEEHNLVGKQVIISVGRLVHRKGQDQLIESMPLILAKIPEAVLLIIGSGPYLAKLASLVKRHNLEQHVRFIGRLSFKELPDYFRLGDLFAMPSRSRFFGLEVEGLGIVYLEASAAGIPVVAGNSGGAPDAVLNGETGLVVNGKDTSEISDAIIKILQNHDLRLAMSARGRSWVVEMWSWKIWGARFKAELFGE